MMTLADVEPASPAPLLTWALVTAACALVLAMETIFLWWRSNHNRSRRLLRTGAALAALAAIGVALLALRTWAVYQDYSSHGVDGGSPPLTAVLAHEQAVQRAIALYQATGWTAIALTAAFLMAGAMAISRYTTPSTTSLVL